MSRRGKGATEAGALEAPLQVSGPADLPGKAPGTCLSEASDTTIRYERMPDHLVRRLHQMAVSIFQEETAFFEITPVQFAVLAAAARRPGMDQAMLAHAIGCDRTTIGGVVDRLEGKKLIQRKIDADDRRSRHLELTAKGRAILSEIEAPARRTQQRLLEPIPPAERETFMATLAKLVARHEEPGRDR